MEVDVSKGYKGGDFEREIAKCLSLWWTNNERDDIFWRTSQSGGRATQRAKFGKKTYGSHGDLCAVDPIGEPLIKLFTIELKRGSSHSCPGDLLDFKPENSAHPFAKCLLQATRSAREAGSIGWMMICRRDHRIAMTYVDVITARLIEDLSAWRRPPAAKFDLSICATLTKVVRLKFFSLPLDSFLARVSPQQIIEVVKLYGKA